MDEILSIMTPDEVGEALWLIHVFERWSMPADEADEWWRRIVAQQGFLELRAESQSGQ